MSTLSFPDASAVYTCACESVLSFHNVPSELLKNYVRSLLRLRVILSDAVMIDPWHEVFDITRHFQFLCFSTPLPFNHPALQGVQTLEKLSALLPQLKAVSPDFIVPVTDLRDQLAALVQSDENPLLSKVKMVLEYEPMVAKAIVIRFSRLIPSVQEILKKDLALRKLEVVHPSELEGPARYEMLFVIGSASSYREDEYVFTAPRGRSIEVIRYNFVRDSWKASAAFPRPVLNAGPLSDRQIREMSASDVESFDVEPYRPDVTKVLEKLAPIGSQYDDLEDAVLISLEGDHAVFIDADEDSWTLVIDLRADEASRVRKIRPASKLDRGMFLLLRTEGGNSDYIVPIADRILGPKAKAARAAQQRWKQALRDKVNERGISRVESDLQALGITIADFQNIRNWMSHKCIRTKSHPNFVSILRYIGLEAQVEEIWSLMGSIRTAHVKAGQHIRQLLLNQVKHADLRQLQKLGVMEFELEDDASGSFTAYRVEFVSSEHYPVPQARLGEPFSKRSI